MGIVSSMMSVGAAIKHAVSSLATAYLDLDFSSNSYRLDDTASSFDAAFVGSSPKLTYGTTSNSTMTNSSGEIVWAPHNLVEESEDFSDTSIWLNSNMTGTFVAAPSETDPAGSNGAYLATHADTSVSGAVQMHKTSLRTPVDGGSSGNVYTAAAFFKKPTTNAAQYAVLAFGNNSGYNATATFDLTNVSVATTGCHPSAGEVIAENIVAVGSGWYLCSFTVRRKVQLHTLNVNSSTAPGSSAYNRLTTGDGTSGVLVWGAHVYRSDLGGMAPVPGAATGLETYVPTNGAVEYLPRVGHHVYDGSTWVNEGLLLESEARTNLVTYSQEFENSSWLKTNSSISGTLTSSPDGQTEGRTVTFSGTNNLLRFIGPSWTEGESYTASIWLRSGSVGGVSSVRVSLLVSDTSGSMVLTVNNDVTVTSDWQRVHVSGTAPAGTPGNVRMRLTSLEAGTLDVFGAQLELGDTPSSYMPSTATTQGFRDAQTLTVPSSEFGWNSAGVSYAVEGRMTYADTGGGASVSGGVVQFYRAKYNNTSYTYGGLNTASSRTGQVQLEQRSSVPTSSPRTIGAGSLFDYAPGVLVPYSIAGRHIPTEVQGTVDGVAFSAKVSGSALADLSTVPLEIGLSYMGTISHFRQWDEDIGETGIEEASS